LANYKGFLHSHLGMIFSIQKLNFHGEPLSNRHPISLEQSLRYFHIQYKQGNDQPLTLTADTRLPPVNSSGLTFPSTINNWSSLIK